MVVAAMHRVRSRPERFALPAAIVSVAGGLAVDDVRRDRQQALGVRRIPISRMLADLVHEARDEAGRDLVDPVIVVAELRNVGIALILVVDGETLLVANCTASCGFA